MVLIALIDIIILTPDYILPVAFSQNMLPFLISVCGNDWMMKYLIPTLFFNNDIFFF